MTFGRPVTRAPALVARLRSIPPYVATAAPGNYRHPPSGLRGNSFGQFKGTVSSRRGASRRTGRQAGGGARARVPVGRRRHRSAFARSGMGWCPADPVLKLPSRARSSAGIGDLSLCFEAGRFSAGWSLNRVLKVFLRLRSPVWLARIRPVSGPLSRHWAIDREDRGAEPCPRRAPRLRRPRRRFLASGAGLAATEPLR